MCRNGLLFIAIASFTLCLGVAWPASVRADPVVGAAPPREGPQVSPNLLKGVYVGVGGGLGYQNFDGGLGFAPRVQLDTVSGMLNLRAGYRVHPYVSAELMWEYYTGWDPKFAGFLFPGTEGWSLSGNIKAYATRSRLRPFLLAGIGVARLEPSRKYVSCDNISPSCVTARKLTGFVARFGGGIDMALAESWQLGLEVAYVVTAADLEGLDTSRAGSCSTIVSAEGR